MRASSGPPWPLPNGGANEPKVRRTAQAGSAGRDAKLHWHTRHVAESDIPYGQRFVEGRSWHHQTRRNPLGFPLRKDDACK